MVTAQKLPISNKTKKKGDTCENLTRLRLEYFCNVNDYRRDIGLDFFCEELFQGKPRRNFLVQCKSIGKRKSVRIKVSTINYWFYHRYPVYIFVCDVKNEKVFWISVEENKNEIIKRVESGQKTISFNISLEKELLCKEDSITKFRNQLVADHVHLLMSLGVPVMIGEDYLKTIPVNLVAEMEGQIIENARIGLTGLAIYYQSKNNLDKACALSKAATLIDNSHFNQFLILGQVYLSLGGINKAIKYLQESLSIVQRDKHFLALEEGKQIEREIINLIKSLEKKR